jgi:hypothetical protein
MGLFCGIEDFFYLISRPDITGINPYFIRTSFNCSNGESVIEMNIRDQWNSRL